MAEEIANGAPGSVDPTGAAATGLGAGGAGADEPPPSRERVLDAAAKVFAAEGLDAPMPAVAAAAGVGVGTIYRAFGSKEELIAALAADRVELFGRDCRAALEAPDAWEALCKLFELTADRQAKDYVVTEALASLSDHPRVVEANQRAGQAITELMERAKQQGGLRSDFEPQDLQMFFAALGAAQHTMPTGSSAWKRLLGLLLDGLRSEGATQLSEPPLTSEDIDRAGRQRRERRR
jgi:AcrR family transcriptional regulator